MILNWHRVNNKDNKESLCLKTIFLIVAPWKFDVLKTTGIFAFKALLFKQIFVLRWLNTVFDTSVSFTFFSKTLDALVAKNGSKQVNNTNFNFLIIKLTYMPLPWQRD